MVLVPEDATRRKCFLESLETLQGAKIRSEWEIWFADPLDPEIVRLLDKARLRSLPAMLLLDSDYKRVNAFRLGEDCVPVQEAMAGLASKDLDSPLAGERVRVWAKGQSPDQFLAFAKARAEDHLAGAHPPFTGWLQELLAGTDRRLREWAATRLVEAGVGAEVGPLNPTKILLEFARNQFQMQVKDGNLKSQLDLWNPKSLASSPNPPLFALGDPGIIDKTSPFWDWMRKRLAQSKDLGVISASGYMLMSPGLAIQDRVWVLQNLQDVHGAKQDQLSPWQSPLFWIVAEWLMVYGMPADWDAFAQAMENPRWKSALLELRRPLEGIRSYWGSPVELHALACTSDSSEEFWKNPEPCLASWGITRESLIELGTAPPKPTYSGGLIYPQMARISRISGDVRAKLIVDERGEIKWIRPEPGFVLPMFGTQALEFLSRTRFEPALAGGVKHPSDFLMTLRFILH